jgi:aldose 1-epimerase
MGHDILQSVIVRETTQGERLQVFKLKNRFMEVGICNYGATITALKIRNRANEMINVVAGFHDADAYEKMSDHYLGCIIGRSANRIQGATFEMGGRKYRLSKNSEENHLHGGRNGFDKKVWNVLDASSDNTTSTLTLHTHSSDGEEGYPGNVNVFVFFQLRDNRLKISIEATTDHKTPINLTSHSYFNLSGFTRPNILSHELRINASLFTATKDGNIPTGEILSVANTGLDFTNFRPIGVGMNDKLQMGIDHNFVLAKPPHQTGLACELVDFESGLKLDVLTNQPGLQVYTANHWDGTLPGAHTLPYQKYGGVALEPQQFPNAPNIPHFPNTLISPGEVYNSAIIYDFNEI